MNITPEQALKFLTELINDDRLRFLNKREFILLDKALETLSKLIPEDKED